MSTYLNADCMNPETGLPSYPDNYFDLAIVDPPYGIGVDGQKEDTRALNGSGKYHQSKWGRKAHSFKGWDSSIPTSAYFNELFRVSKDQIVWGGNYFVEHLYSSKGWIVWYKGQNDLTMSDCELAWSSFDRPTRQKELNRMALTIEGTIHPTQKPQKLYKWLLNNYAKQGMRLLDTHVGSASSLVVFEEMGFEYVGFELDADYYRDSCKRLEAFRAQPKLFTGSEIFEASKPPTLF